MAYIGGLFQGHSFYLKYVSLKFAPAHISIGFEINLCQLFDGMDQ
jgi:hypothetical protein